jgi:hypothetical protein
MMSDESVKKEESPPKRPLNPYRNQVIEEVAKAVEKMESAFGKDTIASFAIFIRSMKE